MEEKRFDEWIEKKKSLHKYANLSQIRALSTSRLYDKIGQVPDSDLRLVKVKFLELYG